MVKIIVTLREFFFNALIMAGSMLLAVVILHGLNAEMIEPLLKAICLFAIFNACVRALIFWKNLQPFAQRIGLFTILVNAALICLVLKIIPSLPFEGYSSAFWVSALISIFSWLINHFFQTAATSTRQSNSPKIKQAKARVVKSKKSGD